MLIGCDFNCTLSPHLDRSYATAAGRHDSQALRRLLARGQLSEVLEDEMRVIDERAVLEFHAAAHTYFYTLPEVARPVFGWTDGTSALVMQTGYVTLTNLSPVPRPTAMVSQSVLGRRSKPSAFGDHGVYTRCRGAPRLRRNGRYRLR